MQLWQACEGILSEQYDRNSHQVAQMAALELRMHSTKPLAPGTARRRLPHATHGKIEFGAMNRDEGNDDQRFACVSKFADPTALREVLTGVWDLPLPTVLITVAGADESCSTEAAFRMEHAIEQAYVDGLASIAGQAEAWVFTNGIDSGSSSLTGKAARALSVATAGARPRSAFIGVTALPLVMYHERFLPAAVEPTPPEPPHDLAKWTLELLPAANTFTFVLTPAAPVMGLWSRHAQRPSSMRASPSRVLEALEGQTSLPRGGADLVRAIRSLLGAHALQHVASHSPSADEPSTARSVPRGAESGMPAHQAIAAMVDALDGPSARAVRHAVALAAWRAAEDYKQVVYRKHHPNRQKTSAEEDAMADGEAYDLTGYALDPHHSHFLLVDDEPRDALGAAGPARDAVHPSASGGGLGIEWEVRRELESAMHARDTLHEVPLICICLGGGERAYAKLLEVLKADHAIVLIRESGGAAAATAKFVDEARSAADLGTPLSEGHAKVAEFSGGDASSLRGQLARLILATVRRDRAWKGGAHAAPSPLHVYSDHHSPLDAVLFEAVVCSYRRQSARQSSRESRKAGRKKRLQPMGPRRPAVHVSARSSHPAYPARAAVPDQRVPWSVPWGEYAPTHFEHASLAANAVGLPTGGRWADPSDVADVPDLYERMTFELAHLRPDGGGGGAVHDPHALRALQSQGVTVVPSVPAANASAEEATCVGALAFREGTDGRYHPLNPRGRTGVSGRGLLGRWGPNHAADPIVTRWSPLYEEGTLLEVIAIQRKDTGDWALPGGMVDPGEHVSATVVREFREEAANLAERPAERQLMEGYIRSLFANGEVVYRGYVDDPRNTDHAWMETTAYHFHCSPALASRLHLAAGDDSAKVTWLAVDAEREPRYAALYASHREFVDLVAERLRKHVGARSQLALAYPTRFAVPDEVVSWAVPYPEYAPHDFTALAVLQASRDGPPRKGERDNPPRLADPVDILSAPHSRRDIDPAKAGKALLDELREDRYTFEGAAAFGKDGRPHNPRGRTGLRGRGTLLRWGVNHATDTIITRHHPRDDRLQLVAVQRHDGSWAIPGSLLSENEHSKQRARSLFDDAILANRHAPLANRHAPLAEFEARRLSTLLDELFLSVEHNVVYTGYVDDPHNTDNAWIETTAYHFHCSRELGGLLALGEPSADAWNTTAGDLRWLDVDDSDARYLNLFGNHKVRRGSRRVRPRSARAPRHAWRARGGLTTRVPPDHRAPTHWMQVLVERVVQKLYDARRPALLQHVVAWGKREWAARVLEDPDLVDQRPPAAVQQAFQIALKRAADPTRFDVSILELLLDNGALAADVFVSELYTPGGGLDPFGLLHSIAGGDADEHTSSRRSRRSSGQRSARARSEEDVEIVAGLKDGSARVVYATSVTRAARASAPAGLQESGNAVHATTPFRQQHTQLLRQYVEGFDAYAAGRHAPATLDLMIWAILSGASDAAFLLWGHTSSPLRASLIGQEVCARLRKRHTVCTTQLGQLSQRFSDAAVGILDNLDCPDTALRVLEVAAGPHASLCASGGSRKVSILALAIELENVAFVEHRYCQGILDDQWMGRVRNRHAVVRLASFERLLALIVQLILAPTALQFVPLKINDLCTAKTVRASSDARALVRVGRVSTLCGFYQIPLVKWAFAALSSGLYAVAVAVVFYSRLCGAVRSSEYVLLVWTLARWVQQTTAFFLVPRVAWRSAYLSLDVAANACVSVALLSRFLLQSTHTLESAAAYHSVEGRGAPGALSRALELQRADNLIDWADRSAPSWHLRPTAAYYIPSAAPREFVDHGHNMECDWSIELEATRTFAALGLALIVLRMVAFSTFSRPMGVLVVCLEHMLKDLTTWLQPTILITLAFALGNGILVPNHRHEGTAPLTPFPGSDLDVSVGGPAWAMFWALFSAYEPTEFAFDSPQTATLAPLWLWLYLLIALVLMINVLIAMFSQTYARVMGSADAQWRLRRASSLWAYVNMYALPAPFNLVELPFVAAWRLVAACYSRCCCSRGKRAADALRSSEAEAVSATMAYATAVRAERGARAKLRRQMRFEDAHASQHLGAISELEARLTQLHLQDRERTTQLSRSVQQLATRPLLGAPTLGRLNHAASRPDETRAILNEALALFGPAVQEATEAALGQTKKKVDKLEVVIQDIQRKLTMLVPTPPAGAASGGGAGKAAYMGSAHAILSTGVHRPPPVPPPQTSQCAPSSVPMAPPGRAASSSAGGVQLPPLPPPSSTDAGPTPLPHDPHVVATFERFDRDRSRGIDIAELRAALASLGLRADTSQAAALHFRYDRNSDGTLTIDEFANLVEELRRFQGRGQPPPPPGPQASTAPPPPAAYTELPASSEAAADEVRRVFRMYDQSGDGSLRSANLQNALEALGLRTSSEQARAVLERYDADASGTIDLYEFETVAADLRRFHDQRARV